MNSLVRRAVRPFFNLFSAIGKTGLWFTVPMKGKYRLRFYSRKKCIDRNFDKNLSAFENHISRIDRDRGFIEDQNLYKDMYYGASTMAESGCGVIAVYNALKALSLMKQEVKDPLHFLISYPYLKTAGSPWRGNSVQALSL